MPTTAKQQQKPSSYKALQMNACQQTRMQSKVLPVICCKNMCPAGGLPWNSDQERSPFIFCHELGALISDPAAQLLIGHMALQESSGRGRRGAKHLPRCTQQKRTGVHEKSGQAVPWQAVPCTPTGGRKKQDKQGPLAVALCCSPKTCASSWAHLNAN